MDAEYGTWLMLRPRARRALVALEETLGRARGMAEHRAVCEGCRYCLTATTAGPSAPTSAS